MFLLLRISRNIWLLVFCLNIRWISLYSFYFLFPSYLHQFNSNLKLYFIQEYFRYYTDQINILKKQKVSQFITFELIITSELKKLIKCTFFLFSRGSRVCQTNDACLQFTHVQKSTLFERTERTRKLYTRKTTLKQYKVNLILLQSNLVTSNLLNHLLSEMGLCSLHNCCVSCWLKYLNPLLLKLLKAVFLIHNFLVLTLFLYF